MKTILLTTFTLLLSVAIGYSREEIQVTPFSTHAGITENDWDEDLTFYVQMNNEKEYTALYFDLYLPSGISIIEDGLELEQERFEGRTVKKVWTPYANYSITEKEEGHYRITLYHENLEKIKGTEGNLFTFYYLTDIDIKPGIYPIVMKDIQLVVDGKTENATNIPEASSFVKIVSDKVPSPSFDGSCLSGDVPSFVVEEFNKELDIHTTQIDLSNVEDMGKNLVLLNKNAIQFVKPQSTYAQRLKASGVNNVVENNICQKLYLCDNMDFGTNKSFTAISASYTRIMNNHTWGTLCLPYETISNDLVEFFKVSQITTGNDGIMVFEKTEKAICGNTPCVIKKLVEEEITISSNNVMISPTPEICISATEVAGWTMKGVTKEIVYETANNLYYINNNTFFHANGKLTAKPFRAYFESDGTNRASRYRIEESNNGIDQLHLKYEMGKIYDLNGQEIDDPIDGVVYVLNGNKIMFKKK